MDYTSRGYFAARLVREATFVSGRRPRLVARVWFDCRLNPAGLGPLTPLPVPQLHHQQRRAEEERDSIRQDDGQRMDHEAVADPQQEPYVEADQHEQREIADGLAAEGMQGLRKIRQRAQRARGKAG